MDRRHRKFRVGRVDQWGCRDGVPVVTLLRGRNIASECGEVSTGTVYSLSVC